ATLPEFAPLKSESGPTIEHRALTIGSGGAFLPSGALLMPSEAAKYLEYARACARLADRASNEEHRNKLLSLAGVWMDAAMTEEELAEPGMKPMQRSQLDPR